MELTLKTPTHITQANNFYLIYLRYVKIDSYCLPSKKKIHFSRYNYTIKHILSKIIEK